MQEHNKNFPIYETFVNLQITNATDFMGTNQGIEHITIINYMHCIKLLHELRLRTIQRICVGESKLLTALHSQLKYKRIQTICCITSKY